MRFRLKTMLWLTIVFMMTIGFAVTFYSRVQTFHETLSFGEGKYVRLCFWVFDDSNASTRNQKAKPDVLLPSCSFWRSSGCRQIDGNQLVSFRSDWSRDLQEASVRAGGSRRANYSSMAHLPYGPSGNRGCLSRPCLCHEKQAVGQVVAARRGSCFEERLSHTRETRGRCLGGCTPTEIIWRSSSMAVP